jgi:hypothetical protein
VRRERPRERRGLSSRAGTGKVTKGDDIQFGDWIIQRLRAGLARFGRADGPTLTCTMHGWQSGLPTGCCMPASAGADHLRRRPATAPAR